MQVATTLPGRRGEQVSEEGEPEEVKISVEQYEEAEATQCLHASARRGEGLTLQIPQGSIKCGTRPGEIVVIRD